MSRCKFRIPVATPRYTQRSLNLSLALLCIPLSGCATLVGTIPPVEERASGYAYEAPSAASPDWQLIQDPEQEGGRQDSDTSDIAWQSSRTASIISLTSACRRSENATETPSLEELTDRLFQGVTEVLRRESRKRNHYGIPALETTVEGRLSGETVRMCAVVLHADRCTYDAMLIGRPGRVASDEVAFQRFVDSLHLP